MQKINNLFRTQNNSNNNKIENHSNGALLRKRDKIKACGNTALSMFSRSIAVESDNALIQKLRKTSSAGTNGDWMSFMEEKLETQPITYVFTSDIDRNSSDDVETMITNQFHQRTRIASRNQKDPLDIPIVIGLNFAAPIAHLSIGHFSTIIIKGDEVFFFDPKGVAAFSRTLADGKTLEDAIKSAIKKQHPDPNFTPIIHNNQYKLQKDAHNCVFWSMWFVSKFLQPNASFEEICTSNTTSTMMRHHLIYNKNIEDDWVNIKDDAVDSDDDWVIT